MAFLSEIISDSNFPSNLKSKASICFLCGNKVKEGGMWSAHKLETCVCLQCAPLLLDWYIDTLLDTQKIDENNDDESCRKLSNDIIQRYKRKKQKKIKQNKKHI